MLGAWFQDEVQVGIYLTRELLFCFAALLIKLVNNPRNELSGKDKNMTVVQ